MAMGWILGRARLLTEPRARAILTAGGTQAPGANDFYVQGRGYLQRFEKLENVDQAIALLDRALSEDPAYALAHAALGEAYWRKYDLTKEGQWIDLAREHCARALQIDDRLAQVHVTLGLIDRGTGQDEAVPDFMETELTGEGVWFHAGSAVAVFVLITVWVSRTLGASESKSVARPALFLGLLVVVEFFLGIGALAFKRLEGAPETGLARVLFPTFHQTVGALLLALCVLLILRSKNFIEPRPR